MVLPVYILKNVLNMVPDGMEIEIEDKDGIGYLLERKILIKYASNKIVLYTE